MNDKLNIISVEKQKKKSPQKSRRDDAVELFQKKWQENPKQFDATHTVIERERLKRTLMLIHEYVKPKDKKIVDLGCGNGNIVETLAKEGAIVHAIDICETPLKALENKHIPNLTLNQDFVPFTTVEDDKYDLAISTELIAHLPPDHYRLYFSELSRIVHPNGHILCSTALDIYSEDALDRFLSLVETEIKIVKVTLSRHSLYIRLDSLLHAPSRFVLASDQPDYRKQELDQRTWWLSKSWFALNSSKPLKPLWQLATILLRPIINWVEQSSRLLIALEKICEFFDTGISHANVIGLRRPLVEPKIDEIPKERKQKRQVWE